MNQALPGRLRPARGDDIQRLLALWELLFDEIDSPMTTAWKTHAREWFAGNVDSGATTRIPVVDIEGEVIAAAVGTVEIGVPNPQCPTGRGVRLANVITLPAHRGRGYATELVRDVIAWAEVIVGADRIDLSVTSDGQRIYQQLGFILTSAPRMKLVL
ncbi:MAG: GNAT family N-acetyltransferase [Actinobacteria bacterium]|nr:GNAT family N-acetyltransferase [Actinomycetota bacterium]